MMAKFNVLHITNNIIAYPYAIKDSDKHPELVRIVEDEYEMFIEEEGSGACYPASDFFYMLEPDQLRNTFSNDTKRLEDELVIATRFIKNTRDAAINAENNYDRTTVCMDLEMHSPTIVDDRIKLSEEELTFLELRRRDL